MDSQSALCLLFCDSLYTRTSVLENVPSVPQDIVILFGIVLYNH
jgi:hypothetical protein